ncbi:hypothetical protein [Nocardiopsis coralliicola]
MGSAVAAVLAATVALSLAVPRLVPHGYTGLLACDAVGFEGSAPSDNPRRMRGTDLAPAVSASVVCADPGPEARSFIALVIDPEAAEEVDLMADGIEPQLPGSDALTEEHDVGLGEESLTAHRFDTVFTEFSMAYVGAVAENLLVFCEATREAESSEPTDTVDFAAEPCGDYIAAMEADGPR